MNSFSTSDHDTMSEFVRVEYKNERKFVEIKDIDSLTIKQFPALVVQRFQIENAKGKNVYIHDQYDTRVYETEELKFLLHKQLDTLILKVKFEQSPGRRSLSHTFTSKVKILRFSQFCLAIVFEWNFIFFLSVHNRKLKTI